MERAPRRAWRSKRGASAHLVASCRHRPTPRRCSDARAVIWRLIMANVAFIGLGKMGFPMASRLLQAGDRVYAFNRSRGPGGALAGQGAEPAGGFAEATARAAVGPAAPPPTEAVGT